MKLGVQFKVLIFLLLTRTVHLSTMTRIGLSIPPYRFEYVIPGFIFDEIEDFEWEISINSVFSIHYEYIMCVSVIQNEWSKINLNFSIAII